MPSQVQYHRERVLWAGKAHRLGLSAVVLYLAQYSLLLVAGCAPVLEAVLPPEKAELEVEVQALVNEHVARVQTSPEDARTHATLGLVYEANEMWSSAVQCFANAAELDSENALWEFHRAICLERAGHRDQELELLQALLPRLDELAALHQRLGAALLEDGQLAEAEREFRRAGELAPSNPEPVVGCAQVLVMRGDAAQARDLLVRVVMQNPDYKEARYALGLALHELGMEDQARREMALGVGAEPRSLADPLTAEKESYAVSTRELLRRGLALITRREFPGAVALLERAAAKRENGARVLGSLAWAYLGALEYEKARVTAIRVTELDAAEPKAYLTLAFACLGLERADDALLFVERALELAPDEAEVHYTNGRVLGARGEFDKARVALARAIELDQHDLRFPVYLGRVELETGLVAQAVARFRATLHLDPGHLPARTNLARALLVAGDFDAARVEIDAIRRISPNHPKLAGLEKGLEMFTK